MNDIPEGTVWALVLGDGKEFDQQCGGYACRQKSATGELIKVAGSEVEDKLLKFFYGEKWGGWCDEQIDEETAKFIEKEVPMFMVDRNRLNDSCEAWVHGFLDGRAAVLVWGNSD